MSFSYPLPHEDETAIRAIVQGMMDAWNEHDAARFATPFAGDADYVIVDGRHIQGRAAIQDGHMTLFKGLYRDSYNEYRVEQIRLLRQDVAVAHVMAHLVFQLEGREQVGHARFSLVLLKEADQWQVAAFQNTPIQKP